MHLSALEFFREQVEAKRSFLGTEPLGELNVTYKIK